MTPLPRSSSRLWEPPEVGDPFDPAVNFGPVISDAAAHRILNTIDQAVSAAGR